MADTILTLDQIKATFYTLTCQLLGLNPDDPASYSKVRKSWQMDGAPSWGIGDDVVFLRITPIDDPYIQQRDTVYTAGNSGTSNVITSYTRAHSVNWAIYGPNSYDNAETIRNGLYGADLSASNLYLVLNAPAPKYMPELFDGRWWSRSDFSARFYETVTRQGTVPTLKSVNIQIKTEGGVTENASDTTS